eukprot:TRINITY_DN9335_c0_g2_i1.p1 TRINITY_DN9335_c0_g2~~TRINITY_DN9335_c0_g2_i1.p1  ORF type:complete len:491 (-),score=71.98 TRINITY_DN9335_c0_g2_i1:154-1521(-)
MGNEFCCGSERAGRADPNGTISLRTNARLEVWQTEPRWEVAAGDAVLFVSPTHGGRIGLRNLGNTCFMNAGLQCLAHIEPLVVFFLSGLFSKEVSATNPRGSHGTVAYGFADLLRELWQSDGDEYAPRQLRRTLSRVVPHLVGGRQQDVQEFLAYFIDGLHEDLNMAPFRRHTSLESGLEAQGQAASLRRGNGDLANLGDEALAAQEWGNHLRKNKSFLVDLFLGQLRSRLVCCRCGTASTVFDPFLYLTLPVTEDMRKLRDSLRRFLQEEVLENSERWSCKKCGVLVQARKKIDLWKLPPVLVLHLKRFERQGESQIFQKICTVLQTGLTVDFREFLPPSSVQKEQQVYELTCVANHSGSYGSGHYTAICRHPIDGFFYSFDDTRVKQVDSTLMVTSRAYVYFLVRRDEGARGPVLRRQSMSKPSCWPHGVCAKDQVVSKKMQRDRDRGTTTDF